MSTTDAVVKALPKLVTTTRSVSSVTSSATTSTTSYSAIVTPPSAAGNPNIWNPNHKPNGTVFIAVGSIAGAIFVAVMLWFAIAGHLSRRIARKTLMEEQYKTYSHAGSGFYDDGDEKEFLASLNGVNHENEKRSRKSRLSFLGGGSGLKGFNSWDSLPEYQPELGDGTMQESFNPIQDFPRYYNRNSLFISPTIEVAQQQQQGHRSRTMGRPYHQSSLSATSLLSSDDSNPLLTNELHKPERAASPERKEKKSPGGYHKRNKSSLGLTPISSTPGSGNVVGRNTKGQHRKQAPSMYLEDLLKENDSGQ